MKNKTWLGFLVGIVTVWVVSVIGVMLFKYWYFNLSWSASRISLSNILSLGSAIGAIAVAVFAWMAYRYAIDGYKKQAKINEITKAITYHHIKLVTHISMVLGDLNSVMIENMSICQIMLQTEYETFTPLYKDTQEINNYNNKAEDLITSNIIKTISLINECQIFYSALSIKQKWIDDTGESLTKVSEFMRCVNVQIHEIDHEIDSTMERYNILGHHEAVEHIRKTCDKSIEYYQSEVIDTNNFVKEISYTLQGFLINSDNFISDKP